MSQSGQRVSEIVLRYENGDTIVFSVEDLDAVDIKIHTDTEQTCLTRAPTVVISARLERRIPLSIDKRVWQKKGSDDANA